MQFQQLRGFVLASLVVLLSGIASGQTETELRGVWLAWAGANIPSKDRIADVMDKIAAANFNTVYIDVWRYSYPYFQSEEYFDVTGFFTDPALPEGRDILQEAIAEGHRNGLHVEAWFEYGFVAGLVGHLNYYNVYPEWFAEKRDGSQIFGGSVEFRWLSHVNPNGQQFLIDLVQEVITNYDVDGVELDRVRYPELDCGYDAETVAVYQAENGGASPPTNIADPGWKSWRAAKLTEFMAACYDSFKTVNPNIPVSNAPIVYPFGFDNFCQDWRPWINNGHLDFVTPQIYRATNAQYRNDLSVQLNQVNNNALVYPGIGTIVNGVEVATGEIIKMIEETRNRNLPGHVLWFVDTVEDDLDSLASTVYAQPAEHPILGADWRRPAIIRDESDSTYITRSDGWSDYTTLPGYQGGALSTSNVNDEWIEYAFDIPVSGWYEVYAFILSDNNSSDVAPYQITGSQTTDTVFVDQSNEAFRRWYKVTDVFLDAGDMQKVVRLSNDGSGTEIIADAIMLLNSNRAGLNPVGIDDQADAQLPSSIVLHQNYPNPFNPSTDIRFELKESGAVSLVVYNLLGQPVATLADGFMTAGTHHRTWNASDQSSGLYFYVLTNGKEQDTRKMVLMR